MKTPPPKSAYLHWLAGALASDQQPARVLDAPDDLVLGYATGYDAAQIAPFVRSLRAVFDGPWLWSLIRDRMWWLCSRSMVSTPSTPMRHRAGSRIR